MTIEYALRKWFEKQLSFRLRDGREEQSVFVGGAEFDPVEVIREFDTTYRQEFNRWLNYEWKPRQFEHRETLLAYSANADRYLDLKDASVRQQVIPVVGSGMSVASGLPTWKEFLLRVRAFTQCSLSELNLLINSSSFEEAADLLAGGTNSRLLAERIDHELRISDPTIIDGPICILPRVFPNLVVTTNLDRILEHLYELCGMAFEFILWGSRLGDYRAIKNPNDRFLLKLHGDCQNEDGRVVLSREYDVAYATNSPPREELDVLCRSNSLLFLGCSLGPDRTVRLLADRARADTNMPRHYALLPKPGSSDAQIDREVFLSNHGIFPIWYDLPHDDAIMALLDGLDPDGGGS